MTRRMPPIFGRFVPFAAVAAANCVNLPFMRSTEIQEGIQLLDKNGNKLADRQSTTAAKTAIAQVANIKIILLFKCLFKLAILNFTSHLKLLVMIFDILNRW